MYIVATLLAVLLDPRPVTIPDYATVPKIERYATADEYEAARRDARFRLTRVSYESDGLTVFAYVYAPSAEPAAPLPVVVFNRGSYTWKEFAGENLTTFHRLASAGFVVVAPMIRGSGGASGRDELGGKYAAAAAMIWPDYAERKAEIIKRRSAVEWADQFSVPILIMHGGADTDVAPSHSIALAAKLQQLGKPYELVIRSGANHVLTQWRAQRDAHAVEWFNRHR